jgi:predicted transcriptional regulator
MGAGRPHLPEDQARDKAIAVKVEASLRDQVDELAARMDVSRSWVVRKALLEYVAREAGAK